MEAQGIAVAEAVGLPYSLKRVRDKGGLRFVPARLQIYLRPARLLGTVASNEPLAPPWPHLIISIGRRSVPVALALKDVANPYALHIQNPKVPKHRFDLIAAPIHDGYTGDNVVNTFGAVHSVTAERLAGAVTSFAARIDPLPRPRIAVLLGGESQAFSFPPELAASFGATLAEAARDSGGSLLVTPSRRTSPEALRALAATIAGVPRFVWDGAGENPYYAFLAGADAIVVTEKLRQHGHRGGRHRQAGLCPAAQGQFSAARPVSRIDAERGATRRFAGKIETWSYAPINDTELVASVIRRALGLDTPG